MRKPACSKNVFMGIVRERSYLLGQEVKLFIEPSILNQLYNAFHKTKHSGSCSRLGNIGTSESYLRPSAAVLMSLSA